MFTSYFGNIKNIKFPVAICASKPKWFTGDHFPLLAPKNSFLWDYKNNKITEEEYTEQFVKLVLDPLNADDVYQELVRFSDDCTLVCYEKPTEFCHRHIVAVWLEELGIQIKEL